MEITGIILGVGAPNLCSDGRKTKCAIILTDALGLIRVYPIPAEMPFPVWGRVRCEVERNNKDSRRESYKIQPGFNVSSRVESPHEKRALLDRCCLRSGASDPIDYQNEKWGSIAIVRMGFGGMAASMTQRPPTDATGDPEFSWIMAQADYAQKPYVEWESEQGKKHTSHIVGAEVYEGLRKNPNSPWRIYDNMQVMNPEYDHWLLLGNMRNRRNVWVIVHLHRLKKQTVAPAIPLFPDNLPTGWPYHCQEADNEPAPRAQLELFAA